MTKNDINYKKRFLGISHALRGVFLLLKNERNFLLQFVAAVLVTVAGFYFDISPTEWVLQILAIGLVLGMEAINTAIEKIADFMHPGHHPKIGVLKDVAAAAVLFSAITAFVIGLIIYLPKLF